MKKQIEALLSFPLYWIKENLNMKYVLASKSPRRAELLKLVLDNFIIEESSINEGTFVFDNIYQAPEILAKAKGLEVSKKHIDSVIISADTSVFINGAMLNKPVNDNEAFEMLSYLSDKTHKVITGVAIVYKNEIEIFSETTEVVFNKLSTEEILKYIKEEKPLDKAGSYGIQDKGALFVKEIKGDYFNVVGLPISSLNKKLKELGYSL